MKLKSSKYHLTLINITPTPKFDLGTYGLWYDKINVTQNYIYEHQYLHNTIKLFMNL